MAVFSRSDSAIFWFKSFLKPYENFVPVSWDVGDFDEVVEWLLKHDAESKAIAASALHLARTLFSSEQQQKYIQGELARVVHLE
jgi:spore maturation protein CgeB